MQLDLDDLDRPSEPATVIEMLRVVAATVQVDAPEDRGIDTYVMLLHHLPAHVLQLAAVEILRTHTFRVLPLPAEFLNTRAVDEWLVVRDCWPRLLGHWRRDLELLINQEKDNE